MATLPEADQGLLNRINTSLQADPQWHYLSMHANSGDTAAVKQLSALAASKGLPIPDNATWSPQANGFANTGGSIYTPLKIAALVGGGMLTAGALAPLLAGAGGAAAAGAGAGAAGAAGAAAPALAGGSMLTLPALTGGGLAIDGLAAPALAATAGGAAAGGGSTASILGGLGKAATSLASGAAQGRVAESTANQNQFGAQIKGLNAQLDRASVAKQLQEQDYKDQLRGALLSNMQDFQATPPPEVASHMGTVTGGLRPSALGPGRADLGNAMTNTATLDLLQKGDPNTGYTAASTAQMPALPPLPSPGAGTTALGALGPGLSIASLLAQKYPSLFGGK